MQTFSLRQFGVLLNKYYWQTAVLIARNGLARQYRNSFLGMFWTMLQPLTMVMVYTTIMPLIMRTAASNYPLYIVVSLPLWNFFSATLIGASQSILANGETLKRCTVSSTVFPVADVLRNCYTFCISFVTMYCVALLLGLTSLDLKLLLLPLLLLPVLVTLEAAAVAIAFIAPYVRDIGELVMMSMTIIFWLTPIVYTIGNLPPRVQSLMQWNPFYIMMRPIQMVAYDHLLPGIPQIAALLGLTAVSVVVGFGFFRLCRRNYVYYL